MKFNFPKIPLFLSVALLILCSLSFFLLYKKVNSNSVLAKQAEGDWQNEASRRDEIKLLNDSIKAIAAEKEQLETHFVKSSDVVPFLDTIEGLAPQANAKAEVTSVDMMENSSKLLVGVKASGSFSSIYKFLMLLENSPYELEFVSMDIQNVIIQDVNTKGNKISSWEANLKIKLLSFLN